MPGKVQKGLDRRSRSSFKHAAHSSCPCKAPSYVRPCFRNLSVFLQCSFFPFRKGYYPVSHNHLVRKKTIAASGDALGGRSMWTAAILAISGKPHDLRNASAAEW